MDSDDRATTSSDDKAFEKALEKNLEVYEPQIGERVTGKIVAINDSAVIIDCGAKSEAIMDPQELEGQEIGESIEAVVIEIEPTFQISRMLTSKNLNSSQLAEAFKSGLPVKGKITEKVNAGFSVLVGGERAFLPLSKLDIAFVENTDDYLGKTYEFKIIEYSPENKKFIVSRVELLKKEVEEKLNKLWEKITPGTVLIGKVRSMQNFGAFIDVGGIEGLVHISEVSESFIKHPSEVLEVGQEVQVKVLKADPENNRISLSMKTVNSEIWHEFANNIQVGDPFKGTITRKADFGIFIQLQPGIEGLLHISQLATGANLEDSTFDPGNSIEGWIRSIDAAHRRLQLTQKELPKVDPWENISARLKEGDFVEGKVDGITRFGMFAEVEPGLTGLIPFSALKKMGYKKPTKAFPPGSQHRFQVANIDARRKRLALIPDADAHSIASSPKSSPKKSAFRKSEKGKKGAKKQTLKPSEITEFGALLAAALKNKQNKRKKHGTGA